MRTDWECRFCTTDNIREPREGKNCSRDIRVRSSAHKCYGTRLQTWYNFIIPYEKHLRSRRCRISKVWYKKVSTVVNLWLLIQISSCVLCFDPTKIISCLNKNLWRRYKLSRISEIRRLCVCPIQRQKTSPDEKSRTIGLYKLENLVV